MPGLVPPAGTLLLPITAVSLQGLDAGGALLRVEACTLSPCTPLMLGWSPHPGQRRVADWKHLPECARSVSDSDTRL